MSENKNINEFDNLFKEAFNNAEVTPPADAWAGIQSQIGSGAATGASAGGSSFISGLTSIKGIIIAAAVVTGITTTVILTTNSNNAETDNTKVENTVTQNNSDNNNISNNDVKPNNNQVEEDNSNTGQSDNESNQTSTPSNGGANTTPSIQGNPSNDNPDLNRLPVWEDRDGEDLQRDNEDVQGQFEAGDEIEWHCNIVLNTRGNICAGAEVSFGINKNIASKEVAWDFGDGTSSNEEKPNHTYNKPGKYTVKLTVYLTDKGSHQALVMTDERIVVVGGTEASFTAEDLGEGKFRFVSNAVGAVNYQWNFGDDSENTGTANPEHQYYSENSTNYRVSLITTDANGCGDTVISRVTNRYIINKEAPTAPNVFTPSNGQAGASFGINDDFIVAIDGEDYYDLTIISSDNKVVFHTDTKEKTWNGMDQSGNLCPNGTYYYILKYSYIGDDEIREKSGTVTVIREK